MKLLSLVLTITIIAVTCQVARAEDALPAPIVPLKVVSTDIDRPTGIYHDGETANVTVVLQQANISGFESTEKVQVKFSLTDYYGNEVNAIAKNILATPWWY